MRKSPLADAGASLGRSRSYDFIVVGGGSSGCALASRLSEDPSAEVLLIESGGSDRSALLSTPALSPRAAADPRFDWGYLTEPQPEMNGRRLALTQARVLGGGSSINGMVHSRGFAADYDGWAAAGAQGWSYAEVLPYFRRLEASDRGEGELHGGDGPVPVISARSPLPIVGRVLEALGEAGYGRVEDLNGPNPDGFGWYDWAIARGRRASASRSYPGIAGGRRNLQLLTGALAVRLVLQGGRATGVELVIGRERRLVGARREVILCAGSIGSPRLLLLSGVGPAEALRAVDVPVVADLPHVGVNLQNHVACRVELGINAPLSAFRYVKPWTGAVEALRYLTLRTGFLASAGAAAGGFFRSSDAVSRPDMQLFIVPALVSEVMRRALPSRDGFTLMINHGLPHSRGEVTLRSADPLEPPRIDPRYFSDPRDLDAMVSAVERMRAVAKTPTMQGLVDAAVSPPSSLQTRGEIADYLRANAINWYHVAGACRMGRGPQDSVTDSRLRVHGLDGLRVADASVMPAVVNGNTNAAAIMIAERAADLIRAEDRATAYA